MKRWLFDTGPIVAYLDSSDSWHGRVVSTLDEFRGQIHTTSAVVVESMHLVGSAHEGPSLLADFLEGSGAQIRECTKIADLRAATELMRKYADIPMDFADATLVLLADELKISEICTLDRRGFRAYRTSAGKHFSLVMEND